MEVGESFALERADGSRAEGVDFGNDRIRDDEKFDEVGKDFFAKANLLKKGKKEREKGQAMLS